MFINVIVKGQIFVASVKPLKRYGAISCGLCREVFMRDKVKILLWILGDIYADFGSKCMVIMYGPSGVGKTSVLNIFSSTIGGISIAIPANSIITNPASYYS